MKLFIFEYITGGGFIEENLPISLVSEGAAMILSLLKGIKSPKIKKKILLDNRLKKYPSFFVNTDVEVIENEIDFDSKFIKNIINSDYYLIIAPEFEGILGRLTKLTKDIHTINLGSNFSSIRITSDKYKTYLALKRLKKYLPITIKKKISYKTDQIARACDQIKYPVIFKPLDGVSGEGISLINNKGEIKTGLKKIKESSQINEFIIQEYIDGYDVSVSLFITENKIYPLSLNSQIIDLRGPNAITEYNGGYIPFTHRSIDTEDIFNLSRECINLIPGLNGYIGIDFVLKERPYIIEINPRLTTSYIGLNELLLENPYSQIILKSDFRPDLKKNISVFFSRIEFELNKYIISRKNPKFRYLKDFITPLFNFNNKYSGFIILKSKELRENIEKINRIRKYFKSFKDNDSMK
ncbi:MAG: ATP-grasp domain-containing protein [Candidatus Lokiarchaeota archaeon]|nr:ATP-grasp domain-containing protein [Candidatus Lokiarchaeota archaeon]